MLYRVKVDLSFESETDAQNIFNRLRGAFPKATSLAREINREGSGFIEIHKCYHDENPASPCEIIERKEVA